MQKTEISALLVLLLFQALPAEAAIIQDSARAQDAIMTRMLGFQYPLDDIANYTLGWIERWNYEQLEKEFKTIRSNFTQFNLLRIPISWYEMNESILVDHVENVLDLGRKYNFKVIFVIMDRLGGSYPNLTPQNYLEANWTDHENRILNIVEPYKHDSQVYAWALENEANVFQEVQTKWYQHFIPYLKSLDLDTPVCTSFYPLGLNATTLSRYQEIASFGLDFIEFHHYARDVENISKTADWVTSYVELPIFISEFGTYRGLSTYNITTNQRILNDQIQEWEKRPNVIGMSYYRFSNDTDSWTIWNQTSNSIRPEGITLNTYAHALLRSHPYAYLLNLESTNATKSHFIYDSSFQTLIEWPNTEGWIGWHNHTQYDLRNVTTNNANIGPLVNKYVSNYYFEQDFTDWNYWPQTGPPDQFQWKIVSSQVYYGHKALKLWANTTRHNDTQAIHSAMPCTPKNAYFIQAWVKVESVNLGAYAFIQIIFRDAGRSWIAWPESEYVNVTCNLTQIYVSGVAPDNAVDMLITLRTRAWDTLGQSVVAYFDLLTMQETIPASYDGESYAMAWSRGWIDPAWNIAQVTQNYTFLDPSEDVKKLWTFKCRIATVQSNEFATDWKGCFIQLAFTESNPNNRLTWHDSKYLSLNNEFTELTVSAIPPENARGLQMIIKTCQGYYGVMFIDDARLYSQPAIIPKNFTISTITTVQSGYVFSIAFGTLKNTTFRGNLYCGTMQIMSANCSFDAANNFWSATNDTTSVTIEFKIDRRPFDLLIPLLLFTSLICLGIITVILLLTKKRPKKR